VLVSLSTACNLVPHSLYVHGIQLLEADPVFGSGSSDVFRASYEDRIVALKRLRVYAISSERSGIHKVSLYPLLRLAPEMSCRHIRLFVARLSFGKILAILLYYRSLELTQSRFPRIFVW
jgi:hypothetical protein